MPTRPKSNPPEVSTGGLAGTLLGSNILSSGPGQSTMFHAACSSEDDDGIFCTGMRAAVAIQALLYIAVALLLMYGLVEFLRGGGLYKISKLARSV